MTAEVAILNKHAVAMAADSAVTIGDQKIFNTVNKLFALSKHHPVGIMVYSSAEIMGVPVETVVKEFRKKLGRESREELEGYAQSFEEFLRDDKNLFPDEARVRALSGSAWSVISSLERHASVILGESLRGVEGWGHPTKEEAGDAFEKALGEFEKHVKNCPPVGSDPGAKSRKTVEAATSSDITSYTKWLGQSFPLTPALEKKIRKLILDQLFRSTQIGGETGIVIAGFGDREVFPALRSMEFQCSGLGLHNCSQQRSFNVASYPFSKSAQIIPFAQSDVMTLFVEGREQGYDRFLRNFMEGFFAEERDRLLAEDPPKATEAQLAEEWGKRLTTAVMQELTDHAQQEFIGPTMEVVAAMPKEELAILAEALVNLTGLKRKASRDKETVGGPTDVAVLSKGDGFIWISRKHYFDPKLNPSFGARYMEN